MAGLPRTRRRSIHDSRNLSRAPPASLRDHFVIGYAAPRQNPSAVRSGSSQVRRKGLGRTGRYHDAGQTSEMGNTGPAADSNGDSNSSSHRQASATGDSAYNTRTIRANWGYARPEKQTVEARSPHGNLASDEETAGSIRPPGLGLPPASLFSHRLPTSWWCLIWEQDGSDHERAAAPRRADRSRWSIPDQPRHRLSVTRYRAPVCCRHRRRGSNRFEVGRATPQTAVILSWPGAPVLGC